MESSQIPIWSSQVAYSTLTSLAIVLMFVKEPYFPKATTSAPHFGNKIVAPHQSSRQLISSDYLTYINTSTAMCQDLTTSQALPTSNHVADALSRDFHLSWPDLILSLHRFLPQPDGCQLWTPSKNMVSAVISALLNKPSCRESLQGELMSWPQQYNNSNVHQID